MLLLYEQKILLRCSFHIPHNTKIVSSLISDHYVDYFAVLCTAQYHSIFIKYFQPSVKDSPTKTTILFESMRMVLVLQMTNYRCALCHSEEIFF